MPHDLNGGNIHSSEKRKSDQREMVLQPCMTIVIPTFQAPRLEPLLAALAEQVQVEQIREILIVGQQEDTDAFEQWPRTRFIEVTDRPTPARNRNLGATEAQTEWLCFLDSDTVPDQRWLTEMLAAMRSNVSVVAGSVQISDDAGYWAWCDNLIAFENQLAPLNSESGDRGIRQIQSTQVLKSAASINFAIRRHVLCNMGGFDESFSFAAGEDRDLCWRLEQRGIKIAFAPKAVVRHDHNRLDRKAAREHLFRYGLAAVQFRQKHDAHLRWRLATRFARVPLAGEIIGLMRVAGRALMRPMHHHAYLKRYWWAMPGVILLDWSHTQGMLYALRESEL